MVPGRPDVSAQRSIALDWVSELCGGALYRTVLNKYYVDEVYDGGSVRPYLMASRAAAWFDFHIIDGIVNLAATLTVFSSWLSGLFDHYVVDGLVNLASNVTLDCGSAACGGCRPVRSTAICTEFWRRLCSILHGACGVADVRLRRRGARR